MSRLSRLFTNRKRELEEEIQFHLQMSIQDRTDRGEPVQEAPAAAMREFGNVALVKDVTREMWGWARLERLGQDLKYILRQMRKSPGFATAFVATLALGIGASVAMFTVVDHVLLRQLPYGDPDRLVEIKEAGKEGPSTFGAPFLDIQQWQERTHVFQSIAFHTYDKPVCFVEGTTRVLQVNAPKVSTNLFITLGVNPAIGSGFGEQHSDGFAQTGDAKTIVLSDAVWRDGFGGDRKILGKIVKLNGDSYTVVGVMPRGFQFPFNGVKPQIWRPIVLTDSDKIRSHMTLSYRVIARLKQGESIASARSELKSIQAGVSQEYSDPRAREDASSVQIRPYGDSLVTGNVSTALLALLAASGLLWLIASVNATSLLLARATTRQQEIAIRGALGASRWRIVQQLLIEGLVLSTAASLLGLGVGAGALKLFERELTAQFNVQAGRMLSATVIWALLALTILSAVSSSIWPAFAAARASIEPALRQGGHQSGLGRAQLRTRSLLVVTEIAISLTLLAACGLLLRTIYTLRHVPLGFRTDHVIVADMTIPSYKFDGKNMTTGLYLPLVERVQHMPGIQAASLMTAVPLGNLVPMLIEVPIQRGASVQGPETDMTVQFRAVGPELQQVLGLHMLKGRFFNKSDTATSLPVVVVNRRFAEAYLKDDQDFGKIIGQRLLEYQTGKPAEIIGVLDDERQSSVALESQPEIDVTIPQITPDSGFYREMEGFAMNLVIHTSQDPSVIIPEIREAMRKASPELASSTFNTMDQLVADSYGDQRTAARLLTIFAGLAFLLCVAGIYGLLAYLVAQRTRELGLRIALGAQRADVMWLVLRQAGWMLFAGSSLGLILAYVSSLLLSNFLYGVKPHDPLTMGAVTLFLLAGGLTSAYFPARRAAGLDPMQALRAE